MTIDIIQLNQCRNVMMVGRGVAFVRPQDHVVATPLAAGYSPASPPSVQDAVNAGGKTDRSADRANK
jgi:hypothetical protein